MTQQVALPQNNDRLYILVVEDTAETRLLLKIRLQQAGYMVDEAENGQEALSLMAQGSRPNLVLLDLLLPDMHGFTVAEKLQQLSEVPIIILSAQTDTNTKVEALTHYAEDYMTKPFIFTELLARIQRVLMHRL